MHLLQMKCLAGKIRQDEIEQFFGGKCDSFDELKSRVVPLLLENQEIFKNTFFAEDVTFGIRLNALFFQTTEN